MQPSTHSLLRPAMRRTPIAIGVSITLALGLLSALAVMPSLAVNPIEVEPLTVRSPFTDELDLQFKLKIDGHATSVIKFEDPGMTQVVRFTVQPGAMFPWHSHEGSVVVNVTSGELVYVMAVDCMERSYGPGEAFLDPGRGHVHTAFNPGTTPTVLVATFYGPSATAPLSTPATPPADCVVTP
jgi:quercetin dioxygenase-like cupin family protein